MKIVYRTLSLIKEWNWKSLGMLLVFASFFLLPTSRCLYADFDDLGAGARAVAMGGAYAAIADDAFGFYYNPAGMGFVHRGQIGADYGRLWTGLTDNSELSNAFVTLVVPLVGVRTSPAAVERNYMGTLSFGLRNFSLAGTYQETAFYVSYGRVVYKKFAFGLTLKLLQESYTVDNMLALSPVFDYGSKSSVRAASADAGLMYNILPGLSAGLSASDINQPDLGLAQVQKLPFTGRIGLGWRQKDVTWSADCIYKDGLSYGTFGFEKWLAQPFALRAGLMLGGRDYMRPSAGMSFDFGAVRIDYAAEFPTSALYDAGLSHRLSFVCKFGSADKNEYAPGTVDYHYAEIDEKNKTLEAALAAKEAENKRLGKALIDEATLREKEKESQEPAEIPAVSAAAAQSAAEEKPAKAPGITALPGMGPAAAVKVVVPVMIIEPSTPPSSDFIMPEPVVKKIEKPKVQPPRTHIVQKGENLRSIALKYYNDSNRWKEIFKANQSKINGAQVLPGQEIVIP